MDAILPPFLPEPKAAESRHAAVSAWFFGPRAENVNIVETAFRQILEEQTRARNTIYPNDPVFITPEVKTTDLFRGQLAAMLTELYTISEKLSFHTIPFWSPRYNAHMSMEASLPATVGYLCGLLHNQNNVATEASPLTTFLEREVARGLCKMFGYNIDATAKDQSWGHITCGGSIANLESIWSARNLKFYPLSLHLAIRDGSLKLLANKFEVSLCTSPDDKKLFMECSTWELLNLTPDTILNIPDRLYEEFGISQTALAAAMKDFSIQTVGRSYLEKEFGIELETQMFVGMTKHYSWPKGAAIAGIGSKQIIDIPIDYAARVDLAKLREMLNLNLERKQAIYSVVAIVGSTEQGAVDPVAGILELRSEFQKKGLSFIVHCDGAWGGYFTSLIRSEEDFAKGPDKGQAAYIPSATVSPYTKEQLGALHRADSITVDPHKSGYCPYPAGGLCYRDGRMRYLVTWTSSYIFRGGEKESAESMGVYGVEGSKPGAAAVGVYLAHKVIGLHEKGYGTLLGEAIFTCSRLYCHWATMNPEPREINGVKVRLIVTPFTMLPAEINGSEEDLEKQKQFIREHIIGKDNETIMNDDSARDLLAQLGGDLQINAFACNFEMDGKINTDVVEANYLNSRIFNRTAITTPEQDSRNFPLFLTSSVFAQKQYGACLDTYKKRLGLKGQQDLYNLINVTMNPWATSSNFIQSLADDFERIAYEELEYIVARNRLTKNYHTFVLQGFDGDRICGTYLPMFNSAPHRWQAIISCKLDKEAHTKLLEKKNEEKDKFLTLTNMEKEFLTDIAKDGVSFKGRVDRGIPGTKNMKAVAETTISDVEVICMKSLEHQNLDTTYPDKMTFYVYSAQRGTDQKPIFCIDKHLAVSPDIKLCADTITFQTHDKEAQEQLENQVKHSGCWFRLTDVHESIIQPLTPLTINPDPNEGYSIAGLRFVPGSEFSFEAYVSDITDATSPTPDVKPMFSGTLKLGQSVYADWQMINDDPKRAEQSVAMLENSVLGLSDVNTSALVAEYPNDYATIELSTQYQKLTMKTCEAEFEQARARQAQKVVDLYKSNDREAPDWAVDIIKAAENAGPVVPRLSNTDYGHPLYQTA